MLYWNGAGYDLILEFTTTVSEEILKMHPASKSGKRVEVDPYNIPPSTLCSEPWWHNSGYNPVPPAMMQRNASETSSVEQSADGMSKSDGGQNEDDENTTKDSQNNAPMRSGAFKLLLLFILRFLIL